MSAAVSWAHLYSFQAPIASQSKFCSLWAAVKNSTGGGLVKGEALALRFYELAGLAVLGSPAAVSLCHHGRGMNCPPVHR